MEATEIASTTQPKISAPVRAHGFRNNKPMPSINPKKRRDFDVARGFYKPGFEIGREKIVMPNSNKTQSRASKNPVDWVVVVCDITVSCLDLGVQK
jgi:hypothetical protein